jgi:hypothetical protein
MRINGKFSPSTVNGDALLDYFSPCPVEQVRWRSADEARAAGVSKARIVKLLKLENRPAGNRPCYGRGAIVMCSGHQLLTADIADALTHGYCWPWHRGASTPYLAIPGRFDKAVTKLLHRYEQSEHDALKAIIRLVVRIDENGAFTWGVSPHDSKPRGHAIEGAMLSAPRGRYLTIAGVAFLFDDVKYMLLNGFWPWEAPAWD